MVEIVSSKILYAVPKLLLPSLKTLQGHASCITIRIHVHAGKAGTTWISPKRCSTCRLESCRNLMIFPSRELRNLLLQCSFYYVAVPLTVSR